MIGYKMKKIVVSTYGEQYLVGPIFVSVALIDNNIFRNIHLKKGQEYEQTKGKLDQAYIDFIEPNNLTKDKFIEAITDAIANSLNTIFKFWEYPIEIYSEIDEIYLTSFNFTEKLKKEVSGKLNIKIFNKLPKVNHSLNLIYKYSKHFFDKELRILQQMYPEVGDGKTYSPEFKKFVERNSELLIIKKRYKEV